MAPSAEFDRVPTTPPMSPQQQQSQVQARRPMSPSSLVSSPLNPNSDRQSRQSLIPLDREASSGSSSGHDTPRTRSSFSRREDSVQLDAASVGKPVPFHPLPIHSTPIPRSFQQLPPSTCIGSPTFSEKPASIISPKIIFK
ncbi:hypothetical protein T439DRAFT_190578 [Meredithblackwellia eburnea MCA 4105]